MIDVQAVSKVGSDGELGHSRWQSVPPWVIPLTSAGVPAAEGDSPRTRGILPVQYQWLSLHSAGGGMVKEASILGFLFSLKVFILVFSRLRHASIHGSGCQMPLELLKEYLSTFLSSPHCILKKPQNKKPQKNPTKNLQPHYYFSVTCAMRRSGKHVSVTVSVKRPTVALRVSEFWARYVRGTGEFLSGCWNAFLGVFV